MHTIVYVKVDLQFRTVSEAGQFYLHQIFALTDLQWFPAMHECMLRHVCIRISVASNKRKAIGERSTIQHLQFRFVVSG